MSDAHPVDRLAALSRSFGSGAAAEKRRLLGQIGSIPRLSRKRLVGLQQTLLFMRAYPDNPAVLRQVTDVAARLREWVERSTGGDDRQPGLLNSGLPGSSNHYAYSYGVLQRLVRLFPGCLELDWDALGDDEAGLIDLLGLTVAPAEVQGLDDTATSLREWYDRACRFSGRTALELTLSLVEASTLERRQQVHVYESCDPMVFYRLGLPGSGRCEAVARPGRTCYQKHDIQRERFPLAAAIRRPLRPPRNLTRRRGQELLDLSLRALCSRNLEIYPLIYANPDDVTVVSCARGIEIVFAGVVPAFRSLLESLLFFLVLKNGVPVAYGPAGIFLGCCEMGINLFPEFRGGEIRFIYAQFMRSLYRLAGARYFFLTPYGMGEDNDDALRSGAFWFYRKLGFRASSPEVERLAVAEEAMMRRRPGYRSDRKTLRRLSHTSAYFDLSGGSCRPLDFGALGLSVSEAMAAGRTGDRRRATDAAVRRLRRLLPVPGYSNWEPAERDAMESLAPLLCRIDDLAAWSARERRALAAIVRAKGARAEYRYLERSSRHPRLGAALAAVAAATKGA